MALKALLGLAIRSYLSDIFGGVVGRTKALANLGLPSYVWTKFKSISSIDFLNPEGRGNGYRLTCRDLYSLRNLRSSLQTQIDSFKVITNNIKNVLSSVFPRSSVKATVAIVYPSSGSVTDLRIDRKEYYQYDASGNQLNVTVPDLIKFTPISNTECLLDIGTTNGYSDYMVVAGKPVPKVKTGPAEEIGDFDLITIEWQENGSVKRRFDMQIDGPFYSSEDYASEFVKTDTGNGRFAFVLKMCRGSGDSFSSLIAQSAQNIPCTIVKKQERKFICITSQLIRPADIVSIQRVSNVTTVILSNRVKWLGNYDLAAGDLGDDRVLKNQPIIVRGTGILSDFAGAFRILSVNRRNRTFTFQNFSTTTPTTSVISSPAIEISIDPFYTSQFRVGEAVSMTFIRVGNNSIVDHYTDMIVGENYNDGTFKGFYMYGKDDIDYTMNYNLDWNGWGYRQAAVITNFPSSTLRGSSKVFTARQFIRGYSNPRFPSFSRGNVISTSTKSFWNRVTAKIPGTVMGTSFPGQVQINGSLEVKQQINFGTDSVLSEFPISLTGTSTASPFYQYFNKEKTLTHFFQIKVGGETCYLPAVSLEDQTFKYEQNFISKQASLTQQAIVALDKFYTAGNYFTFPKGGSWKSSANAINVFFGEIFQPLIRVNSSSFVGKYANVMPTREDWEARRRLSANVSETTNADLNKYYESMNFSSFLTQSKDERYITPNKTFRSSFNGIYAHQDLSTGDKDVNTLVPTNSGTMFMVFKLRLDWAETKPEAVEDEETRQVICGQGVDWELIEDRPLGTISPNYYTENGVGWLVYTKGIATGNRSLFFTNPGPWNELCNRSTWGAITSQPTRHIDFNKELTLTKQISPELFYFMAIVFETRDANNQIITNTDMELNHTASLIPGAYLSGYSGFLPTTSFLSNMRQTEVKFYLGTGTSAVQNVTPNQNAVKIVRATKKTPYYNNKFGRRFGVGLPVGPETSFYTQYGWYNGFQNGTYIPYTYEKYRVSSPLDIATVGLIDDTMTESQLSSLFVSLRMGTFKDFNWGSPI